MGRKKKQPVINSWQNRIVGYAEKPAKDFKFNPLNWREHGTLQRSALNSVLSKIGWVTGVVENIQTGNLIDGHARIEEALLQGEDTLVPYIKVDLSPEEEKEILALLDPIGALATTDTEKLEELMEMLDLENEELEQILDSLIGNGEEDEIEEDEDEGNLSDPNFDYESKFGVIVECDSEVHQQQVFEKLSGQGLKVKVVVV